MRMRNVLLFHHIERTLEISPLNFSLDFLYLVAQRVVGFHNFKIRQYLKSELLLIRIDQIAPKSLFIMLKYEALKVIFIGLRGDKQHDQTVESVAVVLLIYLHCLIAHAFHSIMLADQFLIGLVQKFLRHLHTVFNQHFVNLAFVLPSLFFSSSR
jgi:hypothetical protein